MATYKTIKYIVPVEVVEHTDSINALADVDTSTATPTEGQTIKWNGTNWVPGDIEEAAATTTQKALFGFGLNSGSTIVSTTNLVSSAGVVATDTTGVGTGRFSIAASGYGEDKALFGFGMNISSEHTNLTNLVSNTGVVSLDSTGVGKARTGLASSGYGGDKAIFGFGVDSDPYMTNVTNLVSNAGVVSTDVTGVGTIRQKLAAAKYGNDKAIFGFGLSYDNSVFEQISTTNLVSNAGVVASDTTGVGSGSEFLTAAGYGGDKAIFGFGHSTDASYQTTRYNKTNLVSNTGVVASDTTGVGTARSALGGSVYGGDKAIFGFGYDSGFLSLTNLISNTGVVSSDVTGVGTARYGSSAAGYSSTA